MNSGQNHQCCSIKCISWTAIFVGAFVGVGLGFLLNLFSVAIGLSAFTTSPEGVTAFAVGGFIGFAIGGVVSMFVAGWTAGHLAHPYCPKRNSGALYGFTTWVVALILLILLSGPVNHYVASSTGYISNHTIVIEHPPGEHPAPAMTDTPASAEKVANDTGKAAFALFVLFFLAALSSSFGGHFGMTCRKGDCDKSLNPNPRL
jgi:hypothetical protein